RQAQGIEIIIVLGHRQIESVGDASVVKQLGHGANLYVLRPLENLGPEFADRVRIGLIAKREIFRERIACGPEPLEPFDHLQPEGLPGLATNLLHDMVGIDAGDVLRDWMYRASRDEKRPSNSDGGKYSLHHNTPPTMGIHVLARGCARILKNSGLQQGAM